MSATCLIFLEKKVQRVFSQELYSWKRGREREKKKEEKKREVEKGKEEKQKKKKKGGQNMKLRLVDKKCILSRRCFRKGWILQIYIYIYISYPRNLYTPSPIHVIYFNLYFYFRIRYFQPESNFSHPVIPYFTSSRAYRVKQRNGIIILATTRDAYYPEKIIP